MVGKYKNFLGNILCFLSRSDWSVHGTYLIEKISSFYSARKQKEKSNAYVRGFKYFSYLLQLKRQNLVFIFLKVGSLFFCILPYKKKQETDISSISIVVEIQRLVMTFIYYMGHHFSLHILFVTIKTEAGFFIDFI